MNNVSSPVPAASLVACEPSNNPATPAWFAHLLLFTALLISTPVLASGQQILDFIVWPLFGVFQLCLLVFVARLAPAGVARGIAIALFLLAVIAVAFHLWLGSALTGSFLFDEAIPVLIGLAVAVPASLKSAR